MASGSTAALSLADARDARSDAGAAPARGLRELDDLVRDSGARGLIGVDAPPAVLAAIAAHVERRARAAGRDVVRVDGLPSDDPWRELSARLVGSRAPELDAADTARVILERAGSAVLLVRDDARTHFARAVVDVVTRLLFDGGDPHTPAAGARDGGDPHTPAAGARDGGDPHTLVVVLGARAPSLARCVRIDGLIDEEERELWWEAIARAGAPRPDARLEGLEAWWCAARSAPAPRSSFQPPLGAEAERLLARIGLSQRTWLANDKAAGSARSAFSALGTRAAADELVQSGVLAIDGRGGLVAGAAFARIPDATEEDVRVVAEALDGLDASDSWAAARASELYAQAGALSGPGPRPGLIQKAERAAVRAISVASDPVARTDLWARWEATLAAFPAADAGACLISGVDLALRCGDVERALAFGAQALARCPDHFGALLALGRANVARGDVSTATYWLSKAGSLVGDPGSGSPSQESRALVEVELAEVRHMDGDMDGARRHAEAVTASARAPRATKLQASNVLGKVLLAQRAWAAAEAHFAADACEAAIAGDLTGELRARLNRAISLMSAGRLDDARAMLAAVLEEGETRGELRAVAYALTNLASIATIRREYAEALRLNERAFEARRRLGDKVTLALLITNLAELKLELGMVAEAEQALTFGRHACGPGMPGSRASHFAITAASIHFARGRTAEARAELATALATAGASPHGARLGECWRLSARIALEDGDLAGARAALDRAGDAAETPRESAWVAVLNAAHARASGSSFAALAASALDRARAAGDLELTREAHILLHHAANLEGDAAAARAHVIAAVHARDQIADALPGDMRARFLARRELGELARLIVSLGNPVGVPQTPPSSWGSGPCPTTAPPAPDSSPPISGVSSSGQGSGLVTLASVPALRRMTGRTPAMLSLATAILKVGRSDATVLVHGESGTGKELVAEAIHEASPRRAGPLVKVNCSALVETLLLSELFGHEKGSFTGAGARRRGRFEVAEGGTLFLDEIGDISPRTQVALLRVLSDKTFERVGGVTPMRADVRIVCATHRDLAAMVTRGEFREDLYYRLRGVVLQVPALRHRLTDLPLVATAILERLAAERGTSVKRLSASALEGLARHAWPGNVRELENALRAAALFADGETIELNDLTTNVHGLSALSDTGLTASSLGAVDGLVPRLVSLDFSDVALGGTCSAEPDSAMIQTSKIAQLGPVDGGGSATEVAYAAIRAGISLSELKRDIERNCIARALAETGGNITRAATLLGMKRPRLSQLVKQYGFGSSGAPPEDGDAEDGE